MKNLLSKSILLVLFISLILTYLNNDNNHTFNENLLNKVNAVDNEWINYNGTVEPDNTMMNSQFIPYNSNEDYIVNNDAYVSYYKGEKFITTKLHDAESKLKSVEKADGVILSFNKENKNGIKLINKE